MEHRAIILLSNQPLPEKEAEFNEWFTQKYVPLLLKYTGLKKVTRYQRSEHNIDVTKYLAIYEFDTKESLEAFPNSPEYAAAFKESEEKWNEGVMDRQWWAAYEFIQNWDK